MAVCKLPISNGANINAKAVVRMTPLHIAAKQGSIAVCKLQIAKGANINASDCYNRTPLMLATCKKHVALP